jgi:hypothetical protein
MIRNLYIAYAATWLIHACYLGFLTMKAKRVCREWHEIKKSISKK